ncbi:gliding motility-associated C-terminal domain-containing protein [Hymenobacter monticola]|uniref:Gliding motility-associated C-terminal domain-containing protein n=1 Tax=Hymenobacter monticola TaxID=1705399 RepID=A0ABY4B749_9BACT|nr:gliding motility-associated C-terminal domain-containing protein [Hymenobacter monticola]UOE35002.1 gliding motility-associated C-terminal domain-containing protein [Hymenobacter monticola]
MRKILHSFTMLLFACGLLMGSAQEARASHLLGGDMTYVSLGNNQYRVRFRLYRDCSGITPSAFNLSYKNGGCNTTAQTTPFVQQGAVEAGNPFCAAVSAGPCQGPAGLPNYDVYNYTATVTLAPGQWILSTDQNARPALANIVAGDLYVEATLDNRNQGTTAVANNSPQFDPQDIPIQYACWKQRQTITFSSTEADGDSLVYSLAAPLVACGTPATYNTQPGSGAVLTAINCPGGGTGFFSFPGLPSSQYSPTSPIRLGLDTVGTCPLRTGVARTFNFNQQARTITFTPGYFDPTAGTAGGANKYQIAVLITEYRRINGVRRVIGTVRREANIIVIDCGNNSTPNPVQANPVTNGSNTTAVNTTDTTRIDVRSCNYSRVELNFTDPDNLRTPSAGQLLTVTLPPNINTDPRYLDSGDVGTFSLSGNGTTNPKGVFFFQPSPTTVGRTILLSFKIEDNACPIKGVQNRVLVIRVLRGNYATAAATVGSPGIGGQTPASICPGGSLTIQGNVLRPDSIRRIANNTTVPQEYSFQWSVAAGGTGLPAVTNTQNITVNPTATTRYLLRIAPRFGFAQGLCGDTTSIVVRVVPQPIVTATASLTAVCAGAEVLLTAATTRPNGPGNNLNDTYTYRWTGPGVPANSAGTTLRVRPTTLGVNTYTVTVNGASPYACTATNTVRVTVVPPPTVRLVTSNAYVCSGSPATLTASATTPSVPGFTDTYTYRFEAANGLATADLTKANPTVTPTVTTRYRVTISGNPQTGCADTTSVVVRVVPALKATFATADSVDAPVNGKRAPTRPPVYFTFNNTTGTAAGASVAYSWSYQRVRDVLGDGVNESAVNFSTAATPATPLQLSQSGYYKIKLTATVSSTVPGVNVTCAPTTFERIVFVPDLQIPNIITPNGDNQNDVFKVSTANTRSKLEIFNRWGRKVYEQNNYANNWGGDNQPAGVYYYLLTDGKGVQTKGWIEVVR